MTLLKRVTITSFLFLLMQWTYADEKYNLESIIESNDLSIAMNMSTVLKHSSAKYGDIGVDTYYDFDQPKITLLGFLLESCTVTLFDKKIGHITIDFKGDENSEKLFKLLASSLGEAEEIAPSEDVRKLWIGKTNIHFEISKPSYSDEYNFSISNDIYRKFNKKYNGN